MSVSQQPHAEHRSSTGRTWNYVRLAAGVVAIGLGVAALTWPSATLHVVGVLFGLNLLALGLTRTALLVFVGEDVPVLYRVLGIIFGVLVAIIGILCLRNVAGSVALLLLVVAIGWILDGLAEIFLAVGSHAPANGWRIALGLGAVLAAIALLVWPSVGLKTFLVIGATVSIFVGLCLVVGAIAGMRTRPVTA